MRILGTPHSEVSRWPLTICLYLWGRLNEAHSGYTTKRFATRVGDLQQK